jgi:peroxiredoxin
MHLLRDRSGDLDAAGIRPFGISRDSAWSHRAWAETLGVDVPLPVRLERRRDARVRRRLRAARNADVPSRAAFLIRDGETIEAAWMLGGELPGHRRGDRRYSRRLAWMRRAR